MKAFLLRRAALALCDHLDYEAKWRFANSPSEDDRAKKREARLRRRIERLGGNPEACDHYGVDWEKL